MRSWIFIVFLSIFFQNLSAQSPFVPFNSDYNQLIERYEIKSGVLSTKFYSNFKSGIRRKDIVGLAIELETDRKAKLSKTDYFNLKYLENDSWEWLPDSMLAQADSKKRFLKYFFKKKSDFYQFQDKDLDIHINPILHFGIGADNNVPNLLFTNTRGIELRGVLGKKIGFYSMFTENQISQPEYVRNYIRQANGFPYEGFTKIVDSDSVKLITDFFSARGYITFQPIKALQLQFGHDRNFIGSGIRSMILSDFSAPYLHLKAITTVGRLQYVNIFAQATNRQIAVNVNNTEQFPPKYFALHRLSLNLFRNLNIGLFESVAFGKRAIGFDLNYLNPIIFLRYVEGHLGSVDNSIVGLDFKYNFLRRFSVYGQYVIDEFSKKYSKDWYGKKHALQVGGRYVDVLGIKNLDFQAEYNEVRPYTYSHYSSYSNYVNYNMPLAHPLGANFKEALLIGRYQPFSRITLTNTFQLLSKGLDKDGLNYGGDIQKSYRVNLAHEYNNTIGQGKPLKLYHNDITATYMLRHNLFIDAKYQYRYQIIDDLSNVSNIFSVAIRWNSWQKPMIF